MAVVERKVGVASGDGMRLKARLSRPPAAGTYPPVPTTATIGKSYRQRGNRGRLSGWELAIVAERGGREYSRARLMNIWRTAGWIGGGYGIRADYEKIIHANY